VSFAVSQYRTNQVQTASPARVIVQFYDGAIRFLKLACQAMEAKDYATKGMYLMRTHAIVTELRANLDHTRAPELTGELDRLYVYMLDCITEANIKASPEPLTGAFKVLDSLRGAWISVADDPGQTGVRIVGTP